MEFDTTTRDTEPSISNDDRLAASTKRLTIAPIHDVAAEEPVIRPREDIDPSIPMTDSMVYIASESEDTSTVQNSEVITNVAGLPTKPFSRTMLFVVIGLFAAVTGTIIFLMVIN